MEVKLSHLMTQLRNRVLQDVCLADIQFMELRLDECRKTLRGIYDIVASMEQIVSEEERHKGEL